MQSDHAACTGIAEARGSAIRIPDRSRQASSEPQCPSAPDNSTIRNSSSVRITRISGGPSPFTSDRDLCGSYVNRPGSDHASAHDDPEGQEWRIAGLQRSLREGPESAPKPPFHCPLRVAHRPWPTSLNERISEYWFSKINRLSIPLLLARYNIHSRSMPLDAIASVGCRGAWRTCSRAGFFDFNVMGDFLSFDESVPRTRFGAALWVRGSSACEEKSGHWQHDHSHVTIPERRAWPAAAPLM
jgi:hypothetical protein